MTEDGLKAAQEWADVVLAPLDAVINELNEAQVSEFGKQIRARLEERIGPWLPAMTPPLSNIRQCEMAVVIKVPYGAGPLPGFKATAYHLHDPDLAPKLITSVLAIRLEYNPVGLMTADLLMADDEGKPLVLYENSTSNDEAQKLAELPRTWWRCHVNELRVTG